MSNDPRELLARWASDEILDPFGPVLGNDAASEGESPKTDAPLPEITADASPVETESNTALTETLPQPVLPTLADVPQEPVISDENTESYELASASQTPLEPETTEESVAIAQSESNTDLLEIKSDSQAETPEITKLPIPTQSSSLSTIGQILAYVGVLSLTLGTTFVLWGYFGDKPNYAPMGWLVMTAGQMMLFLGGVTLVSGGMEQTNIEVASRIDLLGEQILRLEQATLSPTAGEQSSASENPANVITSPSEAAA